MQWVFFCMQRIFIEPHLGQLTLSSSKLGSYVYPQSIHIILHFLVTKLPPEIRIPEPPTSALATFLCALSMIF
jgi:hypothetical protein